MNVGVIAFHGQTLKLVNGAKRLREDMGDPAWVDHFFRGHNLLKAIMKCREYDNVYLIGYSKGGELIATLTHHITNIIGACIYEAKVNQPPLIKNGHGDFPVLQYWNSQSGRAHWTAGRRSTELWSRGRTLHRQRTLFNDHGHTKPVLRHNFDELAVSGVYRHLGLCTELAKPASPEPAPVRMEFS